MFRLRVHGSLACVSLAFLVGVSQAQVGRYLGKSVADWAKDLDSKTPAARRGAAFALGKLGSDSGRELPRLLQLMKDQDATVRESAAFAVGEICRGTVGAVGNDNVVPSLTAALKDTDPYVQRSAAVALGNLKRGAAGAVPALEALLSHTNPAVRQNAAWALGNIGVTSIDGLRKLLEDKDALVRRDAANAVGQTGVKAREAMPELLDCCRFPDAEVKKSALAVLVPILGPQDTKACAILKEALADPDEDVRHNAALGMANIGGAEAAAAVDVLIEALRQQADPGMRRQAAAGLKNIGKYAKKALDPLRQALKDPDATLRTYAAVALGGLAEDAEPAVPDLIAMVADSKEDPEARAEAAVAVSRVGDVAAAREGIPKLLTVLKDPSQPDKVRERTLWPLRVHGPNLVKYPEVFDALARILEEKRRDGNKMFRYDSAFLLGMLQAKDAPPRTLDVLLEFLKDKDVKIYTGTSGQTTGGGGEKGTGKAGVVEKGEKDGRTMAVKALQRIGTARVTARPDIMQQLQALRADGQTLPDLREEVVGALKEFGK